MLQLNRRSKYGSTNEVKVPFKRNQSYLSFERSLVLVLGIFLQLVLTVSPPLDHFSYSMFIYKFISSHWYMKINICLKPYWNMYPTCLLLRFSSVASSFSKEQIFNDSCFPFCVCVCMCVHIYRFTQTQSLASLLKLPISNLVLLHLVLNALFFWWSEVVSLFIFSIIVENDQFLYLTFLDILVFTAIDSRMANPLPWSCICLFWGWYTIFAYIFFSICHNFSPKYQT